MATVKKKELPVGRSVRVESGDIYIIQKDIPMLGVTLLVVLAVDLVLLSAVPPLKRLLG